MISQPINIILVTGASGFIGQNLVVRLREMPNICVVPFTRQENSNSLVELLARVDMVVHLAGVNRANDEGEFTIGNVDLTTTVCDAIRASGRNIPMILASSTQASLPTSYGQSKKMAEKTVQLLAEQTASPVCIYRLPGVFGKWCKPYYNSVVATFCHNIARNIPIKISDPEANLDLVYIDDLVSIFIDKLFNMTSGLDWGQVTPIYNITLGELVKQIRSFDGCRTSLISERVGNGLVRALYSTYVSNLPKQKFVYTVPVYGDERGVFVEMLKTHDSGQFSYFTITPGVTRGAHYHHTKTEKFLVVKGTTRMRFRQLVDGDDFEIVVNGDTPQVVDSIPGWVHDIKNIGNEDAIVMLWANEVFDRGNPDCVPCEV
ncbi:NAD-dependent epimerase/dehydratase family protein [Candidatus Njordibacter sp. Uisw_039]|uniref:UDP-2-acetamido-2,6-beta-L-arabino-hexul-4-ose reductase n=1 Tax=Candidatus Njordibacter sp. Uisw_039 TaxID=3230972 RepID=UPI003D557684